MADDALFEWIKSGAPIPLTGDDAAAKRRTDFSQRFFAALYPQDDLGTTEEAHHMAVARNVFDVHAEVNALGHEEYEAVWSTLSAKHRTSIKTYITLSTGSIGINAVIGIKREGEKT